jgi:hypothetical protein
MSKTSRCWLSRCRKSSSTWLLQKGFATKVAAEGKDQSFPLVMGCSISLRAHQNRAGMALMPPCIFLLDSFPFSSFCFVMLLPPFQVCPHVSRLNTPHCQVSAKELSSHACSIQNFIKAAKQQNALEMIHLRDDLDHLGPHLNSFNALLKNMSAIADRMPLEQLADKGADRSTKRSGQHGGVAVPNELICSRDSMFQEAMLGMTDMIDLACQPEAKGKAFVDPEREHLFAGDVCPGDRIEALRVTLTKEKHLVACHVDDNMMFSRVFKR